MNIWPIRNPIMNRIELFKEAKRKLIDLYQRFPDATVIVSMQNQLDYLIQLELGEAFDRERLQEIIIGVQTAREIEPRDKDTASLMYEVANEVQAMLLKQFMK